MRRRQNIGSLTIDPAVNKLTGTIDRETQSGTVHRELLQFRGDKAAARLHKRGPLAYGAVVLGLAAAVAAGA